MAGHVILAARRTGSEKRGKRMVSRAVGGAGRLCSGRRQG
jgi:hypothetical protein